MHVLLLDKPLQVFSLQQSCGVHEAKSVGHFVFAGVVILVMPNPAQPA